MSLEKEVEAHNLGLKRASELLPMLLDWLAPFLGSKLVTAENYLVAKARTSKPKYEKDSFRWHLHISAYSILLHSDQYVAYTDKPGGSYKETSVRLGSLDKQVLTQISTYEEVALPDELTLKKIQQTRKDIVELEQKVVRLKQSIQPF